MKYLYCKQNRIFVEHLVVVEGERVIKYYLFPDKKYSKKGQWVDAKVNIELTEKYISKHPKSFKEISESEVMLLLL